jgi:hypothetical protein
VPKWAEGAKTMRGNILARTAGLWLVIIVSMASPHLVFGGTVDNPGPFTANVTGGYVKVGSQRLNFDPAQLPSFFGDVDSDGNMTIPPFVFPDITEGNTTVRFEVRDFSTGTIDPVSGNATLAISQIFLRILSAGGFTMPDGCGIGPVNGILTTGVSGSLLGQPYDQTTGTATYVNNDVALPRSTGCGLFGGIIDNSIGLPSPAGNNEFQLVIQFDPILTGS